MLPTGLSMLWEPVDAVRALRERFGFDGPAAAVERVAGVLEETWGVTVVGCTRVVVSAQNAILWTATEQGGLVVKLSRAVDRFPALAASARVLTHLGERALPVAAPLRSRDGRARVVVEGPAGPLSAIVQPELGGSWLDVSDDAAVRAAGACLARIHQELRGWDDPRIPTVSRVPVSTKTHGWSVPHHRAVDPATSARLSRLVAALPDLESEPQPVHQDYRAANVLTHASAVVGVLDFDEIVVGHPVGDLALASVYLSTRFTDWSPTPGPVREQLRAGYESVRPLAPTERLWYDALVLWLGIRAVPGAEDPYGWADALGQAPAG